MRLTWTFYPRYQSSITLTVEYIPKLDTLLVPGYLVVETNTAYVSWSSFHVFNHGTTAEKKSLFGSLLRVDEFNPLTTL